MMQDLVVHALYIAYVLAFLLGLATVFTWVERKQSAVMSDRIGANRAYIAIPFTKIRLVWMGLFHGLADGAKMILKENFTPATYDRVCYQLAPWLAAVPVLVVFAVVPFGGTIEPAKLFPALADWFGDRTYPMQIASLDAGAALGAHAVVLHPGSAKTGEVGPAIARAGAVIAEAIQVLRDELTLLPPPDRERSR